MGKQKTKTTNPSNNSNIELDSELVVGKRLLMNDRRLLFYIWVTQVEKLFKFALFQLCDPLCLNESKGEKKNIRRTNAWHSHIPKTMQLENKYNNYYYQWNPTLFSPRLWHRLTFRFRFGSGALEIGKCSFSTNEYGNEIKQNDL